jgi:nucleoid DNA-binding protein
MAESIGIKIIKANKNAEPVYFGVARHLNGQSGPELFTPPISINCGIKEAPTAPTALYSTPQLAIEASINNATGISPSTIHEVLRTALTRIKWVIARGGLVDLDQFGQFKAVWSSPITRIDPITGKVTQTPSQRTVRFTFKSDFLSTPSR